MLGKLARYLRILGYDTIFTQEDDLRILNFFKSSKCVLLTRDKFLCKRAGDRCFFVKSDKLGEQLLQLALEVGICLKLPKRPLRCTLCNSPLMRARYLKDRGEVWKCPKCGQHYWKGSHIRNIEKLLERLRREMALIKDC
jgi:uncharacterized protein with PIN domain